MPTSLCHPETGQWVTPAEMPLQALTAAGGAEGRKREKEGSFFPPQNSPTTSGGRTFGVRSSQREMRLTQFVPSNIFRSRGSPSSFPSSSKREWQVAMALQRGPQGNGAPEKLCTLWKLRGRWGSAGAPLGSRQEEGSFPADSLGRWGSPQQENAGLHGLAGPRKWQGRQRARLPMPRLPGTFPFSAFCNPGSGCSPHALPLVLAREGAPEVQPVLSQGACLD